MADETNAAPLEPTAPAITPEAATPATPAKRGRRKAAAPAKAYPGAGDEPTPEDMQWASAQRAEAEAAGRDVAAPWPNAATPPVNPMTDADAIKRQRDALDAQRLKLLPGYRRYQAERDSGSGKYRQGRIYALPEPQPEALFRPVE